MNESDSGSRTPRRTEGSARIFLWILACAFVLSACAPGAILEPKTSPNEAVTRASTNPNSTSGPVSRPRNHDTQQVAGSEESTTANPSHHDTREPADHGDSTSTEASTDEAHEKKESEQSKKEEDRKKRRRVLLKTAYDDRSLGEDQASQIEAELGIYADENLERYVRSVAVRLLRYAPPQPFDYEFKIVDQTVANAFAIPGGKIYVSRGLLAMVGSEDELAAVLGHEITHAAERHAAAGIEHASRINPLTIGILRAAAIAAYGRQHELDADRGGQILSAKAGYDPNGIATFLRKLDASERYEVGWSRLPSFLATHPTSPERSALASQRSSELVWQRVPSVADMEKSGGVETEGQGYFKMVDGLVLGPDPAGGLFKDNRFVHPDMRFSLRFPPGWATQNSPQAVIAVSPNRDAEASLSGIGAAGDLDKTIDDFLHSEADGDELRIIDRRPIQIGDLPGVRVVGKASGLYAIMAFVEYEGVVFRLAMLSTSGAQRKYRGRANAFMQSFRPLDEKGIYSLEVTRLRIARALEGETLEQLSKRTHNDLELVYTGVLNDLFASTTLRKGQRVKIGLSEPYFPAPRDAAGKKAEDRKGDDIPEDEAGAP